MFRHFFISLIIALNFIGFSSAIAGNNNAPDSFKSALKKMTPSVANAGTIDYKTACATCAQIGASTKKAVLYSKDNNQRIELSVLSEEEANSAFSELVERKDIPYGFAPDGCYARAHLMDRILEDKGIIAGKAFVEGELYVDTTRFGEIGWAYHVAPVVLVKKGPALVPYVFDPSLFDRPVSFVEWKALMTKKPKAKLDREYYTNRFAYDPNDRTANYTDYQEEAVEDMKAVNRNFSNLLYRFDHQGQEQ
ncbi:MAG: protein-glutamine glutaminase family protein [Bacteriovorax sp.]